MSKPKIDTVAAISTPAGRSAISLIRVSGPDTFKILKMLFTTGGKKAFPLPSSAYYGSIIEPETGLVADKCLVTTFLAPKSYTGEDLAEISTHGNPVIVSRVMQLLLKNGARAAEAGEFTRRAFLNGKMDLLEVEALSQLLTAGTASQARMALNQLDGLPSQFVARIRERLLTHLVQLEASLNFPEDAVESIDEHLLARELKLILGELRIFAQNARNGNLVAEGLRIVLVGRPNSGKSSLMNYMLGRDRAIVTEIAGTTRDTLEESVMVGDFQVKIIDTAGLGKPGDRLEAMGIQRTNQAMAAAFAVIGVFDGSQPANDEDYQVLKMLQNLQKPVIVVQNKADLPEKLEEKFLAGLAPVRMSALQTTGLPELVTVIGNLIVQSGIAGLEEMVLLGAQQSVSLDKALMALDRAEQGIGNLYQDMLAIDLEEAVRELGRVNGETVDLNTLDLIFERFCIGK